MLSTVTNHPVHILRNKINFSPSALIPFCSFGDDMEIVGQTIDGFDIPVCDSFTPKKRNDQLCYELNLDKLKDEKKIQKQLEHGLSILLDYNEERQMDTEREEWKKNDERNGLFGPDKENGIQIHLDTISNHVFYDKYKLFKRF